MLHHQAGAVANHFRGKQAQPLLQPPALSGTIPKAPVLQKPGQVAKHAKHASSKLPPSGAAALDRAVCTTGSSQTAAGSGISWNPVRLMSPFEKASEAPTGDEVIC